MIFVDTGASFARFVPSDPDHPAARSWFAGNREPILTTDYVIDELLTLLKMRREYRRALEAGPFLFGGEACHLEWVAPDDIESAWAVFSTHGDKGWSFTDCVSLVVMGRLEIATAVAFDEHFRQFGTVTVVP